MNRPADAPPEQPDEPQPSAATTPETDAKPSADEPRVARSDALPGWTRVRENAEAVLVAIILALVIRHFSLEAFEIPTGSMAPGLHGVHIETTCPNCATCEAVGIRTHQLTGKVLAGGMGQRVIYEGPCAHCELPLYAAVEEVGDPLTCPRCKKTRPGNSDGYHPAEAAARMEVYCRECDLDYAQVYEPGDWQGGHKILVNKFIYKWRDPVRWEVIVFKFNRQRNYIKRLVGLPGEEILVSDGDVHINGEIERKPVWAQDHLWFPVHDSEARELWAPDGVQAWRQGPGWKHRSEGGFAISADHDRSALTYERSIKNRYPYNGRGQNTVGAAKRGVRDLRVVADLQVESGDGNLTFVVVNNKQHFLARLPSGGGGGALILRTPVGNTTDWKERELLALPAVGLAKGRAQRVDFWVADRQLVLRMDGEVVAEYPLPKEFHGDYLSTFANTVSVEARDVQAHLSRVQLFRDIHYTSPNVNPNLRYAINDSYQIGPDHFFALGDNSPSSLDSRAWGHLDRDNLLGRAFGVFWPALPWRWQVKWIR